MTVDAVLPQSWWRWPPVRLSLRALMILVLVLGGAMGWVVRSAHVQRDAVAAIVRGGGNVWYDWEVPRSRVQPDGEFVGGVPMRKRAAPWPKWLFDRLGPDFLGTVRQVRVGSKDPDAVMARATNLGRVEMLTFTFDAPVSDAGMTYLRALRELKEFAGPIRGGKLTGASLESLKGLTELRELLLASGPVLTDADLVHLKGLTALQHLQLSASTRNTITDAGVANFKDMVDMRQLSMTQTAITSDGLNHLRGMTRLHTLRIPATRVEDLAPIRQLTGLKFLHLANTRITDAGLAPVAGFTALESLMLRDTPITDAGLKHLRGATSLTQLDLGKTKITDAGLADLAALNSLQRLELASTAVSDAGLSHLAGLSSLKTLILNETKVTDAGLEHVAKLTSLTNLDLGKTKVTDAGVKNLTALKNLTRLTIDGSAVTKTAVTALQNTMPELRVVPPPFPARAGGGNSKNQNSAAATPTRVGEPR